MALLGALAMAIGLGLAPHLAKAAPIQAAENANFFGRYNQNQTEGGAGTPYLIKPITVNDTEGNACRAQEAPVACVPTSVINGYVFINNRYGIEGLGGNGYVWPVATYDTINILDSSTYMNTQPEFPFALDPPAGYQAGTSINNAFLGNEKFPSDNASYIRNQSGYQVAIQTIGQSAAFEQAANGAWLGGVTKQIPTVDFMAQQLSADKAVEIMFTWTDANGNPIRDASGNVNGHCVSLYGINYDPAGNSGTIDIVDPFASSLGLPTYTDSD